MGAALLAVGAALGAQADHGGDDGALSAGLLGLGLAGLLVGFVLSGVATLMAGLLPRWCGLLLIVCLPLAGAVAGVLGEPGGGIALGLVWLALGYVLASRRDLSAWLGSGRG